MSFIKKIFLEKWHAILLSSRFSFSEKIAAWFLALIFLFVGMYFVYMIIPPNFPEQISSSKTEISKKNTVKKGRRDSYRRFLKIFKDKHGGFISFTEKMLVLKNKNNLVLEVTQKQNFLNEEKIKEVLNAFLKVEGLSQKTKKTKNFYKIEFFDKSKKKWFALALINEPTQKAVSYQKNCKIAILFINAASKVSDSIKITTLHPAVAFSIIPLGQSSLNLAKWLHEKQKQVILQIPMQAKNLDPDPESLLVEDTAEEIYAKFFKSYQEMPFIVGASQFMGSKFLSDPEKTDLFMLLISKFKLLFVNLKTTPSPLIREKAKKYAVKYIEQDVFLASKNNDQLLRKKIKKALKICKDKGSVLITAEINEKIIAVLREKISTFPAKTIQVVPIKEISKKIL